MGIEKVNPNTGSVDVSKAKDPKAKTTMPPLYEVYLLNDDYTPFDFVINILINLFDKDSLEAEFLAQTIHITGKAVCGIYTKEIAETKVSLVNQCARSNSYPLLCDMEKNQ